MSVLNENDAFTGSILGVRVNRDTAALPATTAEALFTVAGGRVAITSIIGEVTTIIETQANATKLVANPTTGTSANLCGTLDITADEAGSLYGITGVTATALVGGTAGSLPGQLSRPIVNIGTIDLDCAATNTGAIKWTIHYVPIDSGATIVAA